MPHLKAMSRICVLLLLSTGLCISLTAQNDVTGYNVRSVQFQNGGFYFVNGKNWVETNSAGQDFEGITEVKRDDSSVYLKKPGGDGLQINVPGKMIYYMPLQGPSFPLYTITSSSYEVRVTGRTMNYAFYKDVRGALVKTTGQEWAELDSNGSIIATFTETKRDDSLVFLLKNNGSILLADAKNKTTYIKEGDGSFVELYKLFAIGNGVFVVAATVKNMSLSTGGRMYKKDNKWFETDSNGKEVREYTETSIKGMSVYLLRNDGTKFEASLEHGKLNKITGENNKELICTISNAANELAEASEPRKVVQELSSAPSFNNLSSYRFTNLWAATKGTSLDVVNDGKKDKVQMSASGSYSGQYWTLTPFPNKPGYYRLTNLFLGPDYSLDIVNDGISNKISFGKSGLYSGQAWKIVVLPGGYYRLSTLFQGDEKSLDIINDGKNIRLQLAKTGDVSGQYWIITEIK